MNRRCHAGMREEARMDRRTKRDCPAERCRSGGMEAATHSGQANALREIISNPFAGRLALRRGACETA